MTEKMIISGFGGQGVMFMGKILAYAGMLADKEVSWIPSYGPEMRGGTANCSVIVSNEEINCPVVNKPSLVVAMNGPSQVKFLPALVPGGLLVVNSSIVKEDVTREDVRVLKIPAQELAAEKVGRASLANVVVLGAMLAKIDVLTLEDVVAALKEVVAAKRPEMLAINQQALEVGMNYVKENQL
ncbi:MAG: 2-oxoacid:acceptor oxidoreductase family protein [Bacillota bacterium]